jgi:23S rRNA (uracil1939-C5)-methyltransferase
MSELRIDALAFGGDAVGRLDGKVVFVPYGVPGDTIEIEILEERASYSRARLVRLLEPGEGRREPACDLFGVCGGCHWQMVDYPLQIAAKQAIFKRSMIEAAVKEVLPISGAPAELGYRRRCRMHWEVSGGEVHLGYYRRGSRELLDVPVCPLLVQPLQLAVDRIREALGGLGRARGTMAASADLTGQRAHVSVRIDEEEGGAASALTLSLDGSPELAGGQVVRKRRASRFGAEWINLRLPEEDPLWGSAATFAQANVEQDRLLRRRLEQWALPLKGARVLELFAGVGNLTRALASSAAEVVAVESSPACTALLRHNCPDVRVIKGDAVAALKKLAGERFDLVVLDPPREGCAAAAPLIAALSPRSVLYVSCDPMTLARDIRLLSKHGLSPLRAQALDMMPQTYHIEALALLGDEQAPT